MARLDVRTLNPRFAAEYPGGADARTPDNARAGRVHHKCRPTLTMPKRLWAGRRYPGCTPRWNSPRRPAVTCRLVELENSVSRLRRARAQDSGNRRDSLDYYWNPDRELQLFFLRRRWSLPQNSLPCRSTTARRTGIAFVWCGGTRECGSVPQLQR